MRGKGDKVRQHQRPQGGKVTEYCVSTVSQNCNKDPQPGRITYARQQNHIAQIWFSHQMYSLLNGRLYTDMAGISVFVHVFRQFNLHKSLSSPPSKTATKGGRETSWNQQFLTKTKTTTKTQNIKNNFLNKGIQLQGGHIC